MTGESEVLRTGPEMAAEGFIVLFLLVAVLCGVLAAVDKVQMAWKRRKLRRRDRARRTQTATGGGL